jgi:photoactive yellow protein
MSTSVASVPLPSSSSPAGDLHDRPDAELDLLPYGVICLDPEGTIVRYNRVEARFARLDRALVLGKPFFGVVAPCTATPEFEGRFRALVGDPNGPSKVTFPYVFNFRFGAQEVDVEIRRSRSPRHFYVCVGRRKFRANAVRSSPGAERPGIALAELAPEERRLGIVRDQVERRNVVVDAPFFEALQAALREPARAEEIGLAWGRRVAIDLETEAAESFDGALRELPIVTVLELVTRYVRTHGWGHLVVELDHAPAGLLGFHLERSVLAEAAGASPAARCGIVAGFLRAVLSHLAQRAMVVREIRCSAAGHERCVFAATGGARTEELDRAAAQAGDLRSIAQALSRNE